MSRIIQRATPQITRRTQLAAIGKIKCGYKELIKKPDGREVEIPRSVDYFIPDGKYANKFKEAFGDKPNSIEIAFYTDDANEVCREYYELRNKSGKLVAYGDGKTFNVWSTKKNKDGEYLVLNTDEYPTLMNDCLTIKDCEESKWKELVQLFFIIPKIRGVYGCWEFSSRGEKSTIPNIVHSFDMIREGFGRVAWIPFDLQVSFATDQKPDSKKRYPVVRLVPNVGQEHLQLIADYGQTLSTVRGLLTEEKINELKNNLRIEHKPEEKKIDDPIVDPPDDLFK